jgi:hypothetical protein
MATYRFSINVPNPAARADVASLTLEPVAGAMLGPGLGLPESTLKVERVWLSIDPCGAGGRRTLQVKLKPLSSATVTAVVITKSDRKRGTAAFQLVDRRGRRVAGGVTLACVSPPPRDATAKTIASANPCPVILAQPPYAIAPEGDPSQRPARRAITSGVTCDLVAALTNKTSAALSNVQAYLEHLGGSDAAFTPTIWNIGTLTPKQVFYATWAVQPMGSKTGAFTASIVVSSDGTDPTRLLAPISIGTRGSASRLSAGRQADTKRT